MPSSLIHAWRNLAGGSELVVFAQRNGTDAGETVGKTVINISGDDAAFVMGPQGSLLRIFFEISQDFT